MKRGIKKRTWRQSYLGFHVGGYEEYLLVGYIAVLPVENQTTATCFEAVTLLWLFFNLEDANDMFLRNIG
jgi:hypothetical protein